MAENFSLVTEKQNERTSNIDTLSTEEILKRINDEDKAVPYAVEKTIPEITEAVELVVEALRRGGTLFYVGAGTSGRLGVLDAAECPPTFRSDPDQVRGIIAGGREALVRSIEGAEDYPEDGMKALQEHHVSVKDVVCGIATSGKTPFVLGALEYARSQGIPTIAIICNPVEAEEVHADVLINPIVGPEVITGSTRMKAGTATKLTLNMITTTAMIRLGKVYGNLMVDLTAVNKKLVDRAQRIVMQVTGVDRDHAAAVLEQAHYKVKNAILMSLKDIEYAESVRLLEQSDGILRRAIAESDRA
ncbi:MAG TPA: N-acetylmuramic acid 6-phosphate etherase [bacterium]|nr:N-acetylmuramic acid 6-phosphate etherase [bacterium]